jgi:DNA-binding CsgD family transcriptional regulator
VRPGLLREILVGEPLTQREVEVLEGAARGETAEQTGARVYLAGETVKGYRKRAVAKLDAANITHAVVLAAVQGILDLGEIVRESSQ